jgi:hypothetical protein
VLNRLGTTPNVVLQSRLDRVRSIYNNRTNGSLLQYNLTYLRLYPAAPLPASAFHDVLYVGPTYKKVVVTVSLPPQRVKKIGIHYLVVPCHALDGKETTSDKGWRDNTVICTSYKTHILKLSAGDSLSHYPRLKVTPPPMC